MDRSVVNDLYGKPAIDEYLIRGYKQYRAHMELIYPFLFIAILSFFLEVRIELIEIWYDFDEGFRITSDPDVIEAILSEPFASQAEQFFQELLVLFILGIIVLGILIILAILVAVSIAFLTVADDKKARAQTQISRARRAFTCLPALCVGGIIGTFLITIGLMMLVVPGIFLLVKFALAGPAIVIGGFGPITGLKESWNVTSGQFREVFGVLLLTSILFLVFGIIPVIGDILIPMFVLPIFALALALLYTDSCEL